MSTAAIIGLVILGIVLLIVILAFFDVDISEIFVAIFEGIFDGDGDSD